MRSIAARAVMAWVCAALAAWGAASAWAEEQPAAAASAPAPPVAGEASAQAMCPVMTDQGIDPEIWVDDGGTRVYFCCQKCRRLWAADPAKYRPNLVLVANAPAGAKGADSPSAAPSAPAAPPVAPPVAVKARAVSVLERVGRAHVMAVHFPIGLLTVGAFFDLVRRKGGAQGEGAVRALVWFGALAAVVAMGLGLTFEYATPAPTGVSEEDKWLFTLHKWSGISAAAVGVLAVGFVEWRARRPGSRLARVATPLLLLAAIGVGLAGHFGGQMVWGRDFLIPW